MATKKTGISYDKLPAKGGYIEPTDYIPKEDRKKYGLGEYAKKSTSGKKTVKATSPKKGKKK